MAVVLTVLFYEQFDKNAQGISAGPNGPTESSILHFNYSLTGNALTVNYPKQADMDAASYQFTIKSLTASQLVLYYEETKTETDSTVLKYTEIEYLRKE
ncbi:hypothetical protein [Mucilaginibacter pocheonensis]|uniref:Uncharacterized protein n=1 Tax=Mucilaginibacter pocheonensis TaxID=398050 RepID=A0ABU1TBY5_9SPHI|nr:hypothetical protein [Mucilaginibacter pocheonensis]MDR6942912.1 hypothetical protein [Mucilaginibacter pocheonensis]